MPSDVITGDAYWVRGINSILEPTLLKEGEYQWGINVNNSGGIIQPRPGYNYIGGPPIGFEQFRPRGLTIFRDKNDITSLVLARGSEIWVSPYPFNLFSRISSNRLGLEGPISFQRVVRSALRNIHTGAKALISPVPFLIIQGGGGRALAWDGATLFEMDPSDEGDQSIPPGDWMQWSGGRLWVSSGRELHASDLGDPLVFWEERNVAGGGAIFFEDKITGLFQTPDLHSLLVGTEYNMSVVQSGVFDRTQWGSTNDFVKVLLPGIGVTSGKSFAHQYGMTWWYSHGGLIRLDNALNTYRTSKVKFQDQLMMRDKANLHDDLSGIVIKSYGNYLLVSVPAGGIRNPHTWALNQTTLATGEQGDDESWTSAWNGLHTVDMVTGVINGQQRIFALSHDILEGGVYSNVWELFMGTREDVTFTQAQRMPCAFQTRFLGMSKELKSFDFAEIELAEGKGVVDMQVYVCSRRGGFTKIMDKRMSFTQGNINSSIMATSKTKVRVAANNGDTALEVDDTTGFKAAPSSVYVDGERIHYTAMDGNTFTGAVLKPHLLGAQVTQQIFKWGPDPEDEKTIFEKYMPQKRILRTCGWVVGDNSCPVESNKTDNIDRAFSILIKWKGKVAITGIWLYATARTDYTMGKREKDEDLARSINQQGMGNLSKDIFQPETSQLSKRKSAYQRNITPFPIEEEYQAFIL
jgi:hypothetical protein